MKVFSKETNQNNNKKHSDSECFVKTDGMGPSKWKDLKWSLPNQKGSYNTLTVQNTCITSTTMHNKVTFTIV